MALQAAAALLGTTGWAAPAAVLCALVVMWWAFGARGAASAPTKEPEPGPVGSDASAPLTGARQRVEAAPVDLDLGIDFEAFQAQMGDRCDMALDALCESAMDDQSAKVMQDLEDEFGGDLDLVVADVPPPGAGGPLGACRPAGPEPAVGTESGPDFEKFQASVELHCDAALEGICSRAIDDQSAAVLKILEDECGGSSVLDDDTQGDYAREMEETLSRQAAEVRTIEARSADVDGTFDVALEEYHQHLLGELERLVNQPVRCVNLLEVIIEKVRKAGEFLLWII